MSEANATLREIHDSIQDITLPDLGKSVTALRVTGNNGYRYIRITNWKDIRFYVNITYNRQKIKVGWVAVDGSDYSTKNYDWKINGQEALEIIQALASRLEELYWEASNEADASLVAHVNRRL